MVVWDLTVCQQYLLNSLGGVRVQTGVLWHVPLSEMMELTTEPSRPLRITHYYKTGFVGRSGDSKSTVTRDTRIEQNGYSIIFTRKF